MEKREECTALQQIKIALLYVSLLQRERALGVKLKNRGEKNGRLTITRSGHPHMCISVSGTSLCENLSFSAPTRVCHRARAAVEARAFPSAASCLPASPSVAQIKFEALGR